MAPIKIKLLPSKFVVILLFYGCVAQTPSHNKEGIACCVETQLNSIGKFAIAPNLVSGSKKYKLHEYSLSIDKEVLTINDTVDLRTSDSIINWLQQINIDSIKVYSLNANDQAYFIVCSQKV